MGIELSDLSPKVIPQVLEKLQEKPKKSKYNAKKVTIDGITFDSQKEGNRYLELVALQRQGVIRNLKLQREFTLIEGFVGLDGKKQKPLRYICDFYYEKEHELANHMKTWVVHIEDVKGFKTKEYELKKKVMRDHGYYIEEI